MNVDSILQEIGAMKTKMNKKEKIIKTPEEAIEVIKSNMPTSGYQMLRESLDMAITALKEVQQYRKIGTVEECREATEKQKPKKIIIEPYCPTECPTCDIDNFPITLSAKDVKDIIWKVPAAFDMEKVIEQIKILSTGIILNTNICDDYAEGYVRAAKDIIEIVEKGGIK